MSDERHTSIAFGRVCGAAIATGLTGFLTRRSSSHSVDDGHQVNRLTATVRANAQGHRSLQFFHIGCGVLRCPHGTATQRNEHLGRLIDSWLTGLADTQSPLAVKFTRRIVIRRP